MAQGGHRSISCHTGHRISLPERAFAEPNGLWPLLSQLGHEQRERLRLNRANASAAALTAQISNLSFVDVDNTISPSRWVGPPAQLRVAELNAERGRFWCELAVQIRATPALAAVDVWLLNEFDLGMARSAQEHTVRLLAYALKLNYAWATEFIELSNGNRAEQRRTAGHQNQWGLHGNALLSRWPLRDAVLVRAPHMAPLYSSKGPETAGGYEKRLGGRMTLFAKTGEAAQEIVLGATHMQTSWHNRRSHTTAATAAMSRALAALSPRAATKVILGGDTWPKTCSWLGLTTIVGDKSPTHRLNKRGEVVFTKASPQDDYVCGRGLWRQGPLLRLPTIGVHVANTSHALQGGHAPPQFVLSDHPFVLVNLSWEEQRSELVEHPHAVAAPQELARATPAPTALVGQAPETEWDAVYRWRNSEVALRAGENVQRSRDNGELKYSMRSLSLVDGVRSIHVVAIGRPPRWLNTSHPTISWWNETRLLDALRRDRRIATPVRVQHSELSKLAIAYIPRLASRFVLMDDDYYVLPRPIRQSAVPNFFNALQPGAPLLPVQPKKIAYAHRPIPMLRDAYAAAVRGEPVEIIKKIFASSKRLDLLPKWCKEMQQRGTVQVQSSSSLWYFCHDRPGKNESARQASKLPRSTFVFYGKQYHSQRTATDFFDAVNRYSPLFVNVNDDWPLEPEAYNAAMAPFRLWRNHTYPKAAPWEINR